MTDALPPDWDPGSPQMVRDPIGTLDGLRQRCAVARSARLGWSILGHAEVVRALDSPQLFSNEVSTHLSVPNGMDAPRHTQYRRVIDPYFSPERMHALEPQCRAIASELIAGLSSTRPVEIMGELAQVFALRAQTAFLDWPAEMHEPLREWLRDNHEATRSGDPEATAAVALAFDRHIRAVLHERRRTGATRGEDVASRLLREQVEGRELTDEEIVSILRNWTVGELGTIAASVGILIHFLAMNPRVLAQLGAEPELVTAAVDEILRIHPPLFASRRKTTCPVAVGGHALPADARLTLLWASANRDEAVFGDPDEFRLDRTPDLNLLYGRGVHVCPGAPLARLELRVLVEQLLTSGRIPLLDTTRPPTPAIYPAGGFATLYVRI